MLWYLSTIMTGFLAIGAGGFLWGNLIHGREISGGLYTGFLVYVILVAVISFPQLLYSLRSGRHP